MTLQVRTVQMRERMQEIKDLRKVKEEFLASLEGSEEAEEEVAAA